MSQAHDVRGLLTQLYEEARLESPPTTLGTKTFKETLKYWRGEEDPALTQSKEEVQRLLQDIKALRTEVLALTVDNRRLLSTIDELVKNPSFGNYIIGFRYITDFFKHLKVLDLEVEKFDTLLTYFRLSRIFTDEGKGRHKLSGFLLQKFENNEYKGTCDQFTTYLTWKKEEILQEAEKLEMDNLLEPIKSYCELFHIKKNKKTELYGFRVRPRRGAL
jgi:hypothetical protein